MERVVVTGATSMLGVALINEMLKQNVKKIYAVIQPGTSRKKRLPESDRIQVIECSLSDYENLANLIGTKCEIFYHLAWEASRKPKKERFFDVEVGYRNIGYSLKALETAHKLFCRSYVGAGSQAEYGDLREMIQHPGDRTSPVTCYGIAKDTCRRMLEIKSKEYRINLIWMRIFSVYGINDKPDTMIMRLMKDLMENREIFLTSCIQVWDYLYESDAGKALYLVGERLDTSATYCLAGGSARKLKDYVEEVKQIVNPNGKINYGAVPYGKDTVMQLNGDISTLFHDTGWTPQVTFGEGIKCILRKMKGKV